ncbi:hypothetical protein ABKN59_001505 [Abortiporus biennis]
MKSISFILGSMYTCRRPTLKTSGSLGHSTISRKSHSCLRTSSDRCAPNGFFSTTKLRKCFVRLENPDGHRIHTIPSWRSKCTRKLERITGEFCDVVIYLYIVRSYQRSTFSTSASAGYCVTYE